MSFPAAPTVGQAYTNADGRTWVWNGVFWEVRAISTVANLMETPPPSPVVGQIWITESNGYMAYWTGSEWVQVSAAPGAVKGWQPISSGSITAAATTTISGIPAGFDRFRLHVAGLVSTDATLQIQVNGDTTTDLHRRRYVTFDADTGSSDARLASDGSVWIFGPFGQLVGSHAEVVISEDHSGRHGYTSTVSAIGGVGSLSLMTFGSGRLQHNRTISSLVVLVSAGTLSADWTLEGYRK